MARANATTNMSHMQRQVNVESSSGARTALDGQDGLAAGEHGAKGVFSAGERPSKMYDLLNDSCGVLAAVYVHVHLVQTDGQTDGP